MKKDKIHNKIADLEQEVTVYDTQIRELMNEPFMTDYPKVKTLCNGINIIMNQIVVLQELLK